MTTLTLTTESHDASGERSTKEIDICYLNLLLERERLHYAQRLVVRQMLAKVPDGPADFLVEHLDNEDVFNRLQAIHRYLMDNLGWNKWDCRTNWSCEGIF